MLNFLLLNFAVLGNVRVVRWLLRAGADPNATDRSRMAVVVVDEEGRTVDEQPPRQHLMTVLMGAAAAGQVEVARVLLDAGADVNAQDADGYTPLMHAVIMDQAAVAALLLHHGASIDARDNRGRTPLMLAQDLEREQCIPILLQAAGRVP